MSPRAFAGTVLALFAAGTAVGFAAVVLGVTLFRVVVRAATSRPRAVAW